MENLGKDVLEPLGYYPLAHGANGDEVSFTTWVNPNTAISVHVYSDGRAELRAMYKLIQLSSGIISWPHPRFEMFERQIRELLEGMVVLGG